MQGDSAFLLDEFLNIILIMESTLIDVRELYKELPLRRCSVNGKLNLKQITYSTKEPVEIVHRTANFSISPYSNRKNQTKPLGTLILQSMIIEPKRMTSVAISPK